MGSFFYFVKAITCFPILNTHLLCQNTNGSLDLQNAENDPNSITGPPVAAGPKLLPFEFRALEACLESACRCLESEVSC